MILEGRAGRNMCPMRSTGYNVGLAALLLVLGGTGTPAAAKVAYGEAATPDGTTRCTRQSGRTTSKRPTR